MQRLGVHRQAAKEDVIRLSQCATQGMLEGHARFEFVVEFARHLALTRL
jgi:hypothetical protein